MRPRVLVERAELLTGFTAAPASWRLWALLTESSVLSSLVVLPYVLDLLGSARGSLEQVNAARVKAGKKPISLTQIAALTTLQSHLIFGLTCAAGLRAASSMELGAPTLQGLLDGAPLKVDASSVASAVGGGVLAGLAALAVDAIAFAGVRTQLRQRGVRVPGAWRSALAVPYGAVAEEVLMRLGAQSLIAAAVRRVIGERRRPPSAASMVPAIVLSNLLFGAGHLPATAALIPLSPAVVRRALMINSIPGVVFGYLFWRKGLGSSMLAHAAADVVIHAGAALARS
ncbi:MAG: CPBP family intramembrane metalloprotease [Chloroflexi bacterium]|nr:CPBP family intramembrane metalloprotease [Chloroflexota bacterium]